MIEGKNVQLRTVKEADLDELYLFLDSIRFKGVNLPSRLISEQRFRQEYFANGFWEESGGTLLVVKEKNLGAIWFEAQERFECLDIHFYVFREEDRGKGIMTEALSLFCAYLFATKKIQRLQISIPGYSKAALRVAQKCGFQFEGIARRAFFQAGAYLDLCIYSLLREEATGIEIIYSPD